jgi:hypothetical protein
MQAKFAKAIARNIRTIAEQTANIALIDAGRVDGYTQHPTARAEATRSIDKAERNIAALLQQPGASFSQEPPLT